MELKNLDVSDESIGSAFRHYIQSAVERVMNELLEDGYTEQEVKETQNFIAWWVINGAEDALSYYFEGTTISEMASKISAHRQFNDEILRVREGMVEGIVQRIVPEDRWDAYDQYDIVLDLELASQRFTEDNITKMVKEKYKI